MAQTFTPVQAGTIGDNPKSEVGLLPWDTSIVFTKTELVSWLKTVGIIVDSNGMELKRLPQFARFGTLSAAANDDKPATAASAPAPAVAAPVHATPDAAARPAGTKTTQAGDVHAEDFRPTRKVSQLTGGGSKQIASLFGTDEPDENERLTPIRAKPSSPPPNHSSAPGKQQTSAMQAGDVFAGNAFRPTRKVRELPGGGSSQIASLFGGDE